MQDVLETALEEIGHMFIVQAIVNEAAFLVGADQLHLSQMAHVMGDGRGADINRFGQLADAHLAAGQGGNDTHPAGVAEGAKQFGHLGGGRFFQFHPIVPGRYYI